MIIAAVVIIAAVAIGAVAMNKSKVVATVGDEKSQKISCMMLFLLKEDQASLIH